MMQAAGVAFDRAAGYYDQTRALPEAVMGEMTRMLLRELDGRGRCLEVAIGTGRMAIPLAEVGIPMYGVDLSLPMLERLRLGSQLPVARASATQLPFYGGSFGSAVACLALHVIPDWRLVVDEVLRVVVPGGVFLVQPPWSWDVEVAGEVRLHFAQQVGLTKPVPGLYDLKELDQYCEARGMASAELPTLHFTTNHRSILETLDQLQRRENAWTWDISPAAMSSGIANTRTWAEQRFGSLTESREMIAPLRWRMYQIPS